MHQVIGSDGGQGRESRLSRRAFLAIVGSLAAAGCSQSKDTPETKAGVPDSERAKDSMDYMRAQMQKKGKRR